MSIRQETYYHTCLWKKERPSEFTHDVLLHLAAASIKSYHAHSSTVLIKGVLRLQQKQLHFTYYACTLYSEYLQLFLQPCNNINGHIVVTHVKSRENICKMWFFSTYDQDKNTRHDAYHDIRFLPLGRRSAITIGNEMVLHIVSFRQSCRSSSLVLYYTITESIIEKEAHVCACSM